MNHLIKNRDKLFSDIAYGLGKLVKSGRKVDLACVDVRFTCGDESYQFPLPTALEYLSEDIYWNEKGDWSEATEAVVEY